MSVSWTRNLLKHVMIEFISLNDDSGQVVLVDQNS